MKGAPSNIQAYVRTHIKTISSCKISLRETNLSVVGRFMSQMGRPGLHTKKYHDNLRFFSAERKTENGFFYICLRLEINYFK